MSDIAAVILKDNYLRQSERQWRLKERTLDFKFALDKKRFGLSYF